MCLRGDKLSAVGGVEAIDVLVRVDSTRDSVLNDVAGEGELDEDAVDLWVSIELEGKCGRKEVVRVEMRKETES